MNWEKVFEALFDDVDFSSEIDRRKAYIRCIEYADEHVDFEDYNLFLAAAADRLGQTRLMKDLLSLKIKATGKEKIHITFEDMEGIQVIANPEGCLYLARVFRALAMSKLPGEHIHLSYGEPPLEGESFPAVFYMEDNPYFMAMMGEKVDGPTDWDIPKREIDPKDIAAFFINEYTPEQLMMTINKPYPVLRWGWMIPGKPVWKKEIREDWSRMVSIVFQRDDGAVQEVGIDLDDESVGFLTEADIQRLQERIRREP